MDNFCGHCGSKLNPRDGTCPKCNKRKNKTTIILTILVILVALIGICILKGNIEWLDGAERVETSSPDITFTTEVAHKKISQINEYFDDSYKVHKLSYNQDGLLSNYSTAFGYGSSERHYGYSYTYNDNMQLIKRQEDGSFTEYYYDTDGVLFSWKVYVGFEEPYYITEYVCLYDDTGNLLKISSHNGQDYTEYVYDDNNRLVFTNSYHKSGDMKGNDETTYEYDTNGLLKKKIIVSNWGFGETIDIFEYNYDYYPFALITYSTNGQTMSTSLEYIETEQIERISVTIDETAEFEIEDGYLRRVVCESGHCEFFYDNEYGESFSEIKAQNFSTSNGVDLFEGHYNNDEREIEIIIEQEAENGYELTYLAGNVKLEHIPLAKIESSGNNYRVLRFDLDSYFPNHNGYVEVRWSTAADYPFSFCSVVENLPDTDGLAKRLIKWGTAYPAN